VTIRERLSGAKRKCSILAYSGIVVFALGSFLRNVHPLFVAAGLAAFGIAMMSILYLLFGIRCPRCQNRVGQLITQVGGSPFSVSRKLRFCPFCGVDLDAQIG